MAVATGVLDDLAAESAELDHLVSGLSTEQWTVPTPAPGWTTAHQIAHLIWSDEAALLTATDPGGFADRIREALANPDTFVDDGARAGAGHAPDELLKRWRAGRTALQDTLRALPAATRLAWFGPPMSVASMASARLMETWAHGQDIADALAVTREPTARLRHVAFIGCRTRDFAYAAHGLTPPEGAFQVELTAPDGALWTYQTPGTGPAAGVVTGPALDFCLLVVKRRNYADLALRAQGEEAERWLGIAQAFAGPPGAGRAPGAHA
jgi:uncharacterized protein (TIGR03084 family)